MIVVNWRCDLCGRDEEYPVSKLNTDFQPNLVGQPPSPIKYTLETYVSHPGVAARRVYGTETAGVICDTCWDHQITRAIDARRKETLGDE